MSELVKLRDVTFDYGREPALTGVDLAVTAGDFIGVVGPSGSGKTTLLRGLAGSLEPLSGRIDRRPAAVGYVPQIETINWHFPVTVREVVLMARRDDGLLPWPSRGAIADANHLLGELGLGGLGDRHIHGLSGGQQQRVFIARALLGGPSLLLLDEPTSGVDVRTRHELMHLLHELHHRGMAIVLTTHDLNGIAAHLPYLVCLNRRVVAAGRPEDVLTPSVLEQTYGAPLEVLSHAGMPVVIEHPESLRGGHHEHLV